MFSRTNVKEKKINRIQIGMEEVKCHCLVTMIFYSENAKDYYKEIWEPIRTFHKFAGYKDNIKASEALLYSNSKLLEREIKKAVSLHFLKIFILGGGSTNQSPSTTNYAVEFSTFGKIKGISTSRVQWISLILGKPPLWSWYFPCQVRMSNLISIVPKQNKTHT